MLLSTNIIEYLVCLGKINMERYLLYFQILLCLLGIIWSSYKLIQTIDNLKSHKTRFKRFSLFGVIFTLTIISSGLFGVLGGNKRMSESILLGNTAKNYEIAQKKQKQEQELAKKRDAFTTFYQKMTTIFVAQEKRLTDKNLEQLTKLYQTLPEKLQKKYQEDYERVKKEVQDFKDTQIVDACDDLFSDKNPFLASEKERRERQQTVTYERYENLLQQANTIQDPIKKETALDYLQSVKEWLDLQQQQN